MGRMKDLYIELREKQIEDDRDLDFEYEMYQRAVEQSEMPGWVHDMYPHRFNNQNQDEEKTKSLESRNDDLPDLPF